MFYPEDGGSGVIRNVLLDNARYIPENSNLPLNIAYINNESIEFVKHRIILLLCIRKCEEGSGLSFKLQL